MKPPTLIAWENGPTGGVSSDEVIAVLLMEHSCGYGLDGQDGGARSGARFQCLVGLSDILERKGLIDPDAHRRFAEFESRETSGVLQEERLLPLSNREHTI